MGTQFLPAAGCGRVATREREAGLSQPIFRRIFIHPRRVGPRHEPEVQRAIAAAQAAANGHGPGSPGHEGEQLQPTIVRIHMLGVAGIPAGSRPTLH
ncbi:hypothetical protein COO09_05840 [Rhizorhabdus dicambivorans]|uniref:Uncharacterized protein n=1 Tax=Rhizorhabdus dicambivorans TaxID=1850238 RepID=A0A2A4FZW3_9SPHN|nr:hypothetical protein COO09_05840 [Rhizorhabdus dicambivorans]